MNARNHVTTGRRTLVL